MLIKVSDSLAGTGLLISMCKLNNEDMNAVPFFNANILFVVPVDIKSQKDIQKSLNNDEGYRLQGSHKLVTPLKMHISSITHH